MKNSLSVLGLSLALLSLTGCGGAAKPQWENNHPTTETSNAVSVAVDPWGQVVSTGRVSNEKSTLISDDLYATAMDSNGKTVWFSRIDIGKDQGRTVSEFLTNAILDDGGNSYLVGQATDLTQQNTALDFGFLVKVDRWGQPVWTVEIPGDTTLFDIEYSNGVLTLGGNVIRQYTTDGVLIRTLTNGADNFRDVELDAMDNVYACGFKTNVKFNANGSVAWSRNNTADVGYDCTIDITGSGGAVVAHEEYFNDRIQVQLYSASGQRQWQVYIAEPTSNAGSMAGRPMVQETSDGQFVAVTSTLQGRKVVKLSAAGKTVWTVSSKDREAWSMDTDAAGNTYVYGAGAGAKIDPAGKTLARFDAPRTSSEVNGRATVVSGAVYIADGLIDSVSGKFRGYNAKFANP
jgi:hypothetical protein